MSRFIRFMNSNGYDINLDLSEVVGIYGPTKEYPYEKFLSKGDPVWRIKFVLKSGSTGCIDCFFRETAENYIAMMRKENE